MGRVVPHYRAKLKVRILLRLQYYYHPPFVCEFHNIIVVSHQKKKNKPCALLHNIVFLFSAGVLFNSAKTMTAC